MQCSRSGTVPIHNMHRDYVYLLVGKAEGFALEPLVVNDIMTQPVETIDMDDSVEYIRDLFEANHYHHLIVKGDAGECVGVISDRDLLKNISPFIGKPGERTADTSCLKRRAHQIMIRQLIAVRKNTSLRAATRVMLDHEISCLPVVDAKKHCIGIITLRDIVKWAVGELECDLNSGNIPGRRQADRTRKVVDRTGSSADRKDAA